MRKKTSRALLAKTNLYAAFLFLASIAFLQLLLEILRVPSYIFPKPTEIAGVLFSPPPSLLVDLGATIYEIVIGFIIALILGIGLAVLISSSDFLSRLLYPYILTLHLIPKVAIAPLLVIWFGFGYEPKIVLTFLIAFFPIFIDTLAGFSSLQPEKLELMRTLHANKWQIIRNARLPNALPFIFSGMKTGVTLAVIGAIVAEFANSNLGIGFLLLQAMVESNTPLLFAGLVVISLVGIVLFGAVVIAERMLLPWYYLPRKQEGSQPFSKIASPGTI